MNVAPYNTSDFYGVQIRITVFESCHGVGTVKAAQKLLSHSQYSELFKFFHTGHIIRPDSQLNHFDSEKRRQIFSAETFVSQPILHGVTVRETISVR
jgi:hypothetical protein